MSLTTSTEAKETTTTNTKIIHIGNLADVIDEYTILKLFEPFGKITYIDSLVHRTGPKKGQPKGYCFLEYEKKEQALKAINALHGKRIKNKSIVVSFAHTTMEQDNDHSRRKLPSTPLLSNRQKLLHQKNMDAKIRAIEQKLQSLKKRSQADEDNTSKSRNSDHQSNRYKPY
ncbi:unnamed protein product [Rhizopus microsporus]